MLVFKKPNHRYIVGALLIFFGAVMFGAKAVMVKYNYAHYQVDAVSLLILRMLFSAPFYVTILLLQNRRKQETPKLSLRQWGYLCGIGMAGYYMASFLDFWGLEYVTANVERLILFIYPTVVVVLSAIFLKKKITKIQYIALGITYFGVLLAFVPDIQIGLQRNMLFGVMLIFLCSISYALYVIGSGEMIPKMGSLRFTCYSMLISTVIVIVHYMITVGGGLFSFRKEVYWLTFLMAFFTTVIPSFMTSEGIKRIGASNGAIISSIGPVATIIMAYYVLNEPISAWQIVGTVIVLGGVLMISGKK